MKLRVSFEGEQIWQMPLNAVSSASELAVRVGISSGLLVQAFFFQKCIPFFAPFFEPQGEFCLSARSQSINDRQELHAGRQERVEGDPSHDYLLLVEVAHLRRYSLEKPRYGHFSVSNDGFDRKASLFQLTKRCLVAERAFKLDRFHVDVFFCMRIAHHEDPFIPNLACVHDSDHGAWHGLHVRKLVELELVADPLLRLAVFLRERLDGSVSKTKIKPKLLSDLRRVSFLSCLKLN